MELGSADAAALWERRLARTPFAEALTKGAPLFVASGDPPRVAFATPAALAASGADALLTPGARRLATETPLDAPPRREALGLPASPPWLCARLNREGTIFFVAADIRPSAEIAPRRFVWRLDGEDRFAAPDAALKAAFGEAAPREGETLATLRVRLGLDSAWADRIAWRETFSRLRVVWPEPGGAQGRAIWLSGAPILVSGGYQGFRGFGLLTDERVSAPARKATPGDAAALLNLLQRQHGRIPALPGVAYNPAQGPALAIIAALAALLQPKAGGAESKPGAGESKRPAPAAPAPPSGGAEIVVLRPHAAPAAPASPARESGSVALTAQERDAFKEIARALGANVRSGRPVPEAPEREPEPAAPPAAEDFAALLDILPIAVIVHRGGEALYANRTLLDLAGFRDLEDFRARDGLKAMFRGRDPEALAPGGAVASVPVVGAGEHILTVDAQTLRTSWRGLPASLVAMRASREAEHQAELRAVERDLAMHAARARDYAAALEVARDGLARLDRSGRILGMNRGAERLFGYDRKQTAGDSFLTLFAPGSQAQVGAALERLAKGEAGPVEPLSAMARHSEGRLFPVRVDLGRLAGQPDPDFFMVLTDRGEAETALTEARGAKEGAEKESAAKTELLSRVSHEMRTPLHAILGFAEVILEERFGPIGNERYRDYIRDIHASGRHVLSLANDLLDLAKIELGKVELQFAPIDVNAVVRECVALMQPQAARERVIVRLSLHDRLPNVMADERSLRQILLNLMANAVKYNEPGGQVIVSTALDEAGGVILRVRDTGVGMNESELAVALEPFRRVPGGRDTEGTGLGLPLAKALVEANHADFSIKSRKDQGTLVEIAFPVRQAAQ